MEAAKSSKFNVREVDVKALFSPEEPPEETFLYIVEREGEVGDDWSKTSQINGIPDLFSVS